MQESPIANDIIIPVTALKSAVGYPKLVLLDGVKSTVLEYAKKKEKVLLKPSPAQFQISDEDCLSLLDSTLANLGDGLIRKDNFKSMVNFYLRLMAMSRQYVVSKEKPSFPQIQPHIALTNLLASGKWSIEMVLNHIQPSDVELGKLDGFVFTLHRAVKGAAKQLNVKINKSLLDEHLTRIYLIGLYTAYERDITALEVRYKDHLV